MRLEWAAAQLRHRAPHVYHAPGYWPTSDGVVPYHVVWTEYAVMMSMYAMDRLQHASGIALAHGGDELAPAREEARALVMPEWREGGHGHA